MLTKNNKNCLYNGFSYELFVCHGFSFELLVHNGFYENCWYVMVFMRFAYIMVFLYRLFLLKLFFSMKRGYVYV